MEERRAHQRVAKRIERYISNLVSPRTSMDSLNKKDRIKYGLIDKILKNQIEFNRKSYVKFYKLKQGRDNENNSLPIFVPIIDLRGCDISLMSTNLLWNTTDKLFSYASNALVNVWIQQKLSKWVFPLCYVLAFKRYDYIPRNNGHSIQRHTYLNFMIKPKYEEPIFLNLSQFEDLVDHTSKEVIYRCSDLRQEPFIFNPTTQNFSEKETKITKTRASVFGDMVLRKLKHD